jgi:hypothetical protein
MISDWRIERIADQSVSLTGPSGTTTLEPKADLNLDKRWHRRCGSPAP